VARVFDNGAAVLRRARVWKSFSARQWLLALRGQVRFGLPLGPNSGVRLGMTGGTHLTAVVAAQRGAG
jgi:hypothetical protein